MRLSVLGIALCLIGLLPATSFAVDRADWPSSRLMPLDIVRNFPICAVRSGFRERCPRCGSGEDAPTLDTLVQHDGATLRVAGYGFALETRDWKRDGYLERIDPGEVVFRYREWDKEGRFSRTVEWRLRFDTETGSWTIDAERVLYFHPLGAGWRDDVAFQAVEALCAHALTFPVE